MHACGNCGCLWITVNAVSAILRIIFGQFAHDFRVQKMFWKFFGNCWKKYWKDTGNCWKKYLKNTGNCCQKYWKNTGNWWGKYWKILEFHIWNVVGTLEPYSLVLSLRALFACPGSSSLIRLSWVFKPCTIHQVESLDRYSIVATF